MCVYYNLTFEEKITIYNLIIQGLIALGVLLAFWQYHKKKKRENEEGLVPKLNIQKKVEDNLVLIKTSVSNHTSKNIKIKSAFLVITRHNYNFLHEINNEFCCAYTKLNDLSELTLLKKNKGSFCHVIPLNYYYDENVQVSNETLRYVKPIDQKIDINEKLWDVRFFVFPEKGQGLHRSVHTVFKGSISNIQMQNKSSTKTKKL